MNSLFSALSNAAGGKSPPKNAATSNGVGGATGTTVGSNPFGASGITNNLIAKVANKIEDEIFQ